MPSEKAKGNKALVATCIACQKTLSTEVMVSLAGCEDGRPNISRSASHAPTPAGAPPASAASIHFASNTGPQACALPHARTRASH